MKNNFQKKLFLVNPTVGNPILGFMFSFLFRNYIPFSLLILAGLTPRDYKIVFFNQKMSVFRRKIFRNTLVGITCTTASAKRAYKLALKFRGDGASVVMGGPHVSALPEEALRYVDSVVIGEAESVWKIVLSDYENNSLKKVYKGEPLADCFSPVYDYFVNLDYRILKHALIPISRGCKYNCDFCAHLPSPQRYMDKNQLLNIIQRMKDRRPYFMKLLFPAFILFNDDNIFSNPNYAKGIFKELIPLKIEWISQSSIDIAFDDEALKLAQQSGCKMLFIGFESIYPKELKKTSVHNINSPHDYIEAVKKIKSHGIKVIGAFIIGFDYYKNVDYLKLLLFLISTVIKSRFYWITLTILTPFPGSQLFDRLKRENRIITYDWNKYDLLFHVVFKPKIARIQLALWFFVIRLVTIFCSTMGLIIYLASVSLVFLYDFARTR